MKLENISRRLELWSIPDYTVNLIEYELQYNINRVLQTKYKWLKYQLIRKLRLQ